MHHFGQFKKRSKINIFCFLDDANIMYIIYIHSEKVAAGRIYKTKKHLQLFSANAFLPR